MRQRAGPRIAVIARVHHQRGATTGEHGRKQCCKNYRPDAATSRRLLAGLLTGLLGCVMAMNMRAWMRNHTRVSGVMDTGVRGGITSGILGVRIGRSPEQVRMRISDRRMVSHRWLWRCCNGGVDPMDV